jgi:hypothetical protein
MLSGIRKAKSQLARRHRQLRKLWSERGLAGVTNALRSAAAERIQPRDTAWPVDRRDVMASDLSNLPPVRISDQHSGEPITLNWVMIPAAPGSGGHTTIFRIVRYLEAHGYRNRVYFYNVHGADHDHYAAIARDAYGFHGPVGRVEDGMEDAHGVVATGWATAYPIFVSRCSGKRFYFVQDFEPSFHAVGALSLLAENTYRMGFHGITAGSWLALKLKQEFAMEAEAFEFGCDTTVYHRTNEGKRSGIVFYARPGAARRGFELGLMAIELFAQRNPGIEIHFYGEKLADLPYRVINHGRISPQELNRIYNQCYAGLSLSMTNTSLVPHEMLAAGCIPVVNEAVHNRVVLDNAFVRYDAPFPKALALGLESVVNSANFETLSEAAARSVSGNTWDDAGARVDGILRRAITRLPAMVPSRECLVD